MEALPNDTKLSGASMSKLTQNDENNNQIKNVSENTQKCSSCGTEKASIVCTACTSQVKTTNLDSIPALKMFSPKDNLNLDDYYQVAEKNVDILLTNGHMVYCKDCFEIIHLNLDQTKHIPIEFGNSEPQITLDNENIELIVEDKLDDLLDQIESNSQIEEELNIHKYKNELECLTRRLGEFNEVKKSIRQMNDVIKDDLYLDFGTIAGFLQNKLDEISDKIKEKLKDAYSVVRDLQNKINEKIIAVEKNLKELDALRIDSMLKGHEIRTKETEIMGQIQQINDELKSICEPNFNFNSCYNSTFSCSLFVDNNLYPQFYYHVDLSKVIEAINDLNVQIGPSLAEPKPWTFHDQMYLDPQFEFDAMIHSGIQTDGSFWVQFIAPSENTENVMTAFKKNRLRSNQFLEEINRYVRSKIISDKEWKTYAQLNETPKEGDKCFCLSQDNQKWYRAKILKIFDKNCHVLYVDTGYSDLNILHTLDHVLPWRDFDISSVPNRAIKCFLYNKDSDQKYESQIQQESKFLFKDLTSNQPMKCVLIEPTLLGNLEEVWISKIYKINDDKKNQFVNINKKVIDQNLKEIKKLSNKDQVKFSCTDIRLDKSNSIRSNRVSKSSPLSSSSSFTPANNPNSTIVNECKDKLNKVSQKPQVQEPFSESSESNHKTQDEKIEITTDEPFDTNLDYSSGVNIQDTHEENIYIEDQTPERRFYQNQSGFCYVTTSVSSQGIFWIRPFLKRDLNDEFDALSRLIGDFIRRTNYRSYGDLKIDPEMFKKCFVRVSLKKNSEPSFFRGYIEKVFQETETCRVRLMDNGNARELSYNDVYPHRRLDLSSLPRKKDALNDTDIHRLKLNYLAIRCCLFKNSNYSELKIDKEYFNSLVNFKNVYFKLVEQVNIGKIRCWYTEICVNHDMINNKIFHTLPILQQDFIIKKSKSEHAVKNLVTEAEKSSSIPTSNTNRDWVPIETNPITSHIPRSNSMYDLKESTSNLIDSLDDTNRSIKVKSDIQSIVEVPSIKTEEPKNRKNKNRNKKAKSLPHSEGKKINKNNESKSLLPPERNQYESLSPFINEPEWEVNGAYEVQQPYFVSKLNSVQEEAKTEAPIEKDQTFKKKNRKNQCRPGQFYGWNNNDEQDRGGNGGNGGNFSGYRNNSGYKKSRNSDQKQNYNNSYKGRNHLLDVTDEDQNSSAFNEVFLNNNDDSSLDQDLEFDFNESRVMNNLNSSPNSPYQKLFKLNPQINSYEQVLSRISENESIRNPKQESVEEAEKIRSLNHLQGITQQSNKIDVYDTSLDSMPRLMIEDDDNSDEERVLIEPGQGTTLDQTHQIPNRHIINDIETNRSIKTEHKIQQNYKNRSYSAADVALVERNRLNLRPIPSSSSSESTSSSCLTDLKKKLIEDEDEESFASCPEEIKNDEHVCRNPRRKDPIEEKLEKMKKFTISIFVDDFEADSSKTLSNDSSSSSILSLSPKADVENSRLNHNIFTVRSLCEEKSSLEEFEKNEVLHSFKRLAPQSFDEDVFMFTSNPVQVNQNRTVLASKPPLMPTHNQLSTIIELSQECSNYTENDSSVAKKIASLDEIRENWISEIDSNSQEFQKKIDFFNKNPDETIEIDVKNITFRRCHRKSRDYDTLNETRKSRSVSSLSDNCQIVQSLSNNCLASESIQYSTNYKFNFTMESSFNSRPRVNSNVSLNNSVLITDQLFEKFCLKENDEIMGLDENFRPNYLDDEDDQLPSTTSSSLPQKSSSSPDISSYTTDSLFNSHLIITPICSEFVSPNQHGSIISRSPLLGSNQQSTPNTRNMSLKSPASQSSQSSSLPPPPPPPSLPQLKDEELNNSSLPPPPPPPSSFPPAPHFPLIKRDKNSFIETLTAKLIPVEKKVEVEKKTLSAPVSASNSSQNLFETETVTKSNKHIDNYLNIVKKATGVELEPVRRRTTSVSKPQPESKNEFKSANFSLYGLDNDDEQETKRKSLSEYDSIDAKSSMQKIFPSLTDLSEPQPALDEPDSHSFKFPPPPDQFMNTTQSTENSSILPPPPEQKELDALSPHHISSSSSVTTVVKNDSPRLRTFMKSLQNLDQNKSNESCMSLPAPPGLRETSDKNSSCPNLTDSNESKKPFKLDHLLDINPKRLYKNSKFRCRIHDVITENGKFWIEVIYNEEDERKFQEIFKLFNLCSRINESPKLVYKNQRVAVLYKGDWYRGLVIDDYGLQSNKVKVRFLDLGLEKILDKQTDLREIDEKFFNCPLKALQCSIYIDESIEQLVLNNQIRVNDRLRLGKEARKYFVKMVYKKILFAKVIGFTQEYDLESQSFKSICKIKLGCQAHHGVIDVYMYLLSKFDRAKYEFLKELKNHIQSKPLLSVQQESIETTTITTTQTTSNTITSTAITGPTSVPLSPPDSLNATIKRMENFDETSDNDSDDECSQIDEQDEEIIDQEEDYQDDSDDEDDDDDVLFSDAVTYYYSKNIPKDSSLDITPVKDNKFNYTNLKISPVDLVENSTPQDKLQLTDFSTAKISNRLRATAGQVKPPMTPVGIQPASPMNEKYIKMNNKVQNCTSETDLSLTAQCCNLSGLKKWAKSSSNKKTFKTYEKETKYNDNYSINTKSSMNKKVKFHIK